MNLAEISLSLEPPRPRLCDLPPGTTVELSRGRVLYLGGFEGKYALLWPTSGHRDAGMAWHVKWDYWERVKILREE